MLQDDYKINDSLYLIGNLKFDNYERETTILNDSTESLYRLGTIYLPTKNLGFKAFYTKSYIPPSFFNIEFKDSNSKKIDNQEYKYYTIESTYTHGDSKFNIEYYNVRINDFVYFTPIGFINVPYEIKTDGMIFNYDYDFNKNNKLKLNYYFTNLNRNFTNSYKGGYIKFLGHYQKLGYFSSLIYRNGYNYEGVYVDDSFNLNLGVSYNFTKNLSFSIKANNLLDKSTQSIVADASAGLRNPKYVAFDDFDRSVTFSIRWLF
jgi:iron complex outermembrane receptor protein